ncbi:hypothetical protein [Tepidimonas sp.]|uniref:hypothetical protein n=1 Tax=Tepidimonas sp. TaxID=2002775 RepID=UPI00391AAEDE
MSPNQALISKGLRHCATLDVTIATLSEPSPDFKGIKTITLERDLAFGVSEPSPDFKGIKTHCAPRRNCGLGPNQALISKGLRPGTDCQHLSQRASEPSPDFKGIKTVRFAPPRQHHMSEPSPDFKGIKTSASTLL